MRLMATEPLWLSAFREREKAAFDRQGYPHAKLADWRFTPVAALAGIQFSPAGAPARSGPLAGRVLCPVGFHRAALVNGRLEPRHSILQLPAGVRVEGLAELAADEPESLKPWLEIPAPEGLALAALAGALACDGIIVRIGRHVRADRPIHLVHLSEPSSSGRPGSSHARVIIVLEPGASAEIIEESLALGDIPSWKNTRTQVFLGEDAVLRHYRLSREGSAGRRTGALEVSLSARARYESHAVDLGGPLAREDLRVRLAGEGAECALNGLALLRDHDAADRHLVVEHAAAGGTTRALYKAVLDDRARFVFDGLVWVKPGAQKTDASVYNKNLLLSEQASAHSDPEFKILADDVSCRHGGAMGQLSAESLFYLRSRGLSAEEARRMLVYAFGGEMIARVGLEPLRAALDEALHGRMPEAAEAIA